MIIMNFYETTFYLNFVQNTFKKNCHRANLITKMSENREKIMRGKI